MKSKNVALMAVAIAFGLAAAFATSMMYGPQVQAEKVKVVVATQTLPIGTILDEKNLPTLVAFSEFDKDAVPLDAITDPNALKGKKISATKPAKSWFTALDISNAPDVVLPPGHKRFAIKISVDKAVSGFVKPGDHVDVLGMVVDLKDSRIRRPVRLMRNALVLSIDDKDRKEANPAMQALNTCTIAVKDEDAQLLKLFEDSGMSLLLRDDKQPYDDTLKTGYDIVLKDMPGMDREKKEEAPPAPAVNFVKAWFVKKTLKQNEKITEANLSELVEEKEVALKNGEFPGKLSINASDLKNKYLTTDLLAGQMLVEESLSDTEVKKAPVTVLKDPEPAKKKKTITMTIQEGGNSVDVIYEETETGGWRRLDGGVAGDAGNPSKTEEKKEQKDAKPAQPGDGSTKERVTLK
jgi:Flp pilus assembly protein CpaB